MDKTKIQISRETWRELNQLKQTGESFDDVIKRILSIRELAPELIKWVNIGINYDVGESTRDIDENVELSEEVRELIKKFKGILGLSE